ncbi:hypothetical protein EDD17DRAFT_1756885 [Pisolithus thermaeus]|nr:hypothetical protein EDD17DRAFT_1756885 [Pisolithus thermaeus]
MSEVDEADDEGSGIDHVDYEDIHPPQPARAPHVTTMTNVIADKPTKKPWTDQHNVIMATQQLSTWCSNFDSTALTVRAHFLALGSEDTQHPDAIWETCKELLDGLAFLFQDLSPMKPENAYQSQFLLQLLTLTHLQSCIGCPDIPNLDTAGCCAATAFLPVLSTMTASCPHPPSHSPSHTLKASRLLASASVGKPVDFVI